MADLIITEDTLTVSLSALEKVEAIHRDVVVPRAAVTGVRQVADGMTEVHGLRAPGTGFPGVILVGTFRERNRKTFAVVHGRRPAVVVDLAGQGFDRIVVTVDDPAEALAGLA